jgi:dTDP-4-amino-4,6-dideoxygalactose transaminase
MQPALRDYLVMSRKLVNSVEASKHVLSLPMHPGLSDEDVLTVVKYIKEFFRDLKV